MAELRFAEDDDLPRTLRRAREERDRDLRACEEHRDEGSMSLRSPLRAPAALYDTRYDDVAPTGTVQHLDIPILHLAGFLLKSVVAGIPALLLLACLLWFGGKGLQFAFPDVGRMQIFIKFGT